VRDLPAELIGTRTEVRRRGGILPPWTLFAIIILATFGLCLTVTMRTRAEMRAASEQYEEINADVQQLRNSNAAIEQEVERFRSSDKRAIESAARSRLNMVRANEIVVPVE
jgi:cell division protein FtsB